MKLIILFTALIFSAFANATSFACKEPSIIKEAFPEASINWEIIDEDDGYYGVVGIIAPTINGLRLSRLSAIVGGNNEKDSDYLFPINLDNHNKYTEFHFYVKRDLISGVSFRAIYISGSNECPEKLANYRITITHNKAVNERLRLDR